MTPSDVPTRRVVLVVDDEPRNRAVIRARLAREHEVLEAANGDEALALLASQQPVDLVLLDVCMPGMHGLEVCQRIKQTARAGYLPVILVTALIDQDDRNKGLSAGADDFLAKPVDGRELVLRVRAFLRIREQEEQIRAQLERLRRLETLKDDLVSLVVHDLRNPLTSIASVLDLVRLDLQDLASVGVPESKGKGALASAQENLALGKEAALKLRDRIEEVLEVRRIEEGELVLAREPASLIELVRDAAATLEGEVRRAGVALELSVAGAPTVVADRRLVRRALENLIANAIRYSSQVSVRAHVSGNRAVVEVADRGPGVHDQLKPRIFEKFVTTEAGSRRGFGLGLHLVGLVAKAHEVEATVHDREGGGALFRLTFPLAE
jgi:signal transduction histidine kinase